jgi:phosphoglucomutase
MIPNDQLSALLNEAATRGQIKTDSVQNVLGLCAGSSDAVVHGSVQELVQRELWRELDDRFFKKLTFGTSGLRGRTIGQYITAAELGAGLVNGRPQFPCVGTNAMNFFNLTRANRGLAKFLRDWWTKQVMPGRPSIVFSHDTRHFSREFAEFSAEVMRASGVDVFLFESHRPTPELSFAVRHVNATAGVMITASHNPAHDNGFKVYFNEGDPILEPIATGILDEVNAVQSDAYAAVPEAERGTLTMLGGAVDEAYLARLKGVMLKPALLEKAQGLKIVYTPLHGTGAVHVPTILRTLGFNFLTVPEQDAPDGRFPTVKKPNPEEKEALSLALALAEREKADIVIATDPDCDRMGVAARGRDGVMQLMSGNQIGSLMAWYRTLMMFELGILNEDNRSRATIVKTFVTTPLQDAVAARYGVRCVNTLTGFKYIGGKLSKYERALTANTGLRYRSLSDVEARDAQLREGTYFIFGGEESFGYMCTDWIRDKDGNGAVVMFAELAAYAAGQGKTVPDLLDEVFCEFGCFMDHTESPEFPGADGAEKIKRLVNSYSTAAPQSLDGSPVVSFTNYGKDDVRDEEGDQVPKENMLFFDLADGRRFAVRPSGTEPKIKFYFFASRCPAAGEKLDAAKLPGIKDELKAGIGRLWADIQRDYAARLLA